jgi:chromosome segregation ATPase
MSAMDLIEDHMPAVMGALDSVVSYLAQRRQLQQEANMRLIDHHNELVHKYNRLLGDYRRLWRAYEAVRKESTDLETKLERSEELCTEACEKSRQQAAELAQVRQWLQREVTDKEDANRLASRWQLQAQILLDALASHKNQSDGASVKANHVAHRCAVFSAHLAGNGLFSVDPLAFLQSVESPTVPASKPVDLAASIGATAQP